MSEPKRYKHTFLYGTDGFVNESFLIDEKYNMADEGEYVSYEDYARLKAEVERLRNAGDAMSEAMWYGDAERSIWVKKFAETEWNAAKEGKQP